MAMLARLKPFNPRKGLVMRSFSASGVRITHERGWHEVDDSTAAYLKTVHSTPENDESPLAFDVCTPAEAQALEDMQRIAAEVRAAPTNPVRAARQAPRNDFRQLAPGAPTAPVDPAPAAPPAPPAPVVSAFDAASGEFPPDGEGFEDEDDGESTPTKVEAPKVGKQRGGKTGPKVEPKTPAFPGSPGAPQK